MGRNVFGFVRSCPIDKFRRGLHLKPFPTAQHTVLQSCPLDPIFTPHLLMGHSLITSLHIFLPVGSHQGVFSKALPEPEPLNGTHPSSLNQRVSAFPLKDEVRGSTMPTPLHSKPCIQASLEKFSSCDICVALSGCFFFSPFSL